MSFYHSCRDRHCPVCQQRASRDWCERQSAQTLEVAYHHLVLTLPETLNPWVELHPEVIYDQLLKSTWGQTLTRHLHVHCLVPGGALTAQGGWWAVHGEYLFPVRALSRYLRGHFVRSLRARYRHDELSRVEDPEHLTALLDTLVAQEWVVHSKPWLAHTEAVVTYLGRYTQRIALSVSLASEVVGGEEHRKAVYGTNRPGADLNSRRLALKG